MNRLLYFALAVGVVNGLFWRELPKGSYYILESFFVFLLCLFIYLKDKDSFIKFVLIALSFNTLLDEVFFDNTTISINEIIVAVTLPIFWIYKKYKNETNTIR